ncbi:MAG: hypothetical protein HGB00_09905 [Chlorobiaceae bacterium]|nr:hypothetical protein [Chlorobiaceae bacterium]
MMDDLIVMVEKAIESSSHWAETGWAATFGPRNIEVPNLKSAEALPRNVVSREEAVNYWKQVRLTGCDTAESGRKALAALKTGNCPAAADALYLCQYLEKPFEGQARTWLPVYEALISCCS